MSKMTMILAGAAGYVLGAKAGHERYEQIKSAAQKVARDPRVQHRAQQAQTVVKEKATDAAHLATDKMHSSNSSSATTF
jgi:hypothetical protein